jgi:uncharacterized protein
MQTTVTEKRAEHPLELSRIAQDLQIRRLQVENVVQLLDEGNTVPFITRYRKERTGGLDEEVIRQIQLRVQNLRQLADRKQTILKSIEAQGKLTDDLRTAILSAETSKRLEDLYLPYKPKKRSLATIARERGLEPFAEAIWNRDPAVANLAEVLRGMVNPEKELPTIEDVLAGAQHILAEKINETVEVRAAVRSMLWKTGKLCTAKAEHLPDGHGLEYKDYFEFSETVRHIPPHRILAINRGEKENSLKIRLEWDADGVRRAAVDKLPLADHPHAEFLQKTLDDSLARLLIPSLEREIRRELTDEAEEHAVRVFARNLRSLLLQPPLRSRRILAIDPGFRTGCKLAVLDEIGNLLEHGVTYPFGKSEKSKAKGSDTGAAKKGPPPVESAAAGAVVTRGDSGTSPEAVSSPAAVQSAAPAIKEAAALAEGVDSNPQSCAETATSSDPLISAPRAAADAGVVENAPAQAATPEDKPAQPNTPPETGVVEPSLASSPPPEAPVPEPAPAVSQSTPASTPAAVPPREQAKTKLEELIRNHQVNVVAIGNGTACRETEELVSELIAERLPVLEYVVVNEAGASVYSASAIGREEFPSFDATLRGTISIGRRLQDPLSELVKIDPQNVGVGLYQHDIHPRRLKNSLESVIESCVNQVGVDVNTASVALLRNVSGLNQMVARELVDYRKQNGPFKSREQFLQVPSMGPVRFVQAAGFLKVAGGDNPLDETWVHPESYTATQTLLDQLGFDSKVLRERERHREAQTKLKSLNLEELSAQLQLGVPTLKDIVDALARPGRDPREDLPPPIFKKGVLKLEDLQQGMELKGTVLNVVDFGAFVDVGLKDSGLVHISQMANRYIKNPYDIVAVGDVVTVWVLSVDHERRRVSLTMIAPGTPRRPPEKKPRAEASPGGDRPPPQRRQPRPKGRMVAVPKPGAAPARQAKPAGQTPAVSAPPAASQPAIAQAPATGAQAPQRPPPRPRKPHRQAPKPKLSKAALEGAVPLRSFGELGAFFEAQRRVSPPPQPPPEPAPKPVEESEVPSS